MDNTARRFTDEEIIRIYEEEYIGQHVGVPTLQKKYQYKRFYKDFVRLNLKRRNDQEKSRKYNCDETFFDVIDSEEKAYWLGFIYADGYINKRKDSAVLRIGISITESDSNHLEKFKKAIKTDAPIHHYTVVQGYKVGTKYCRIIISNDHVARSLIKHGCVEHKSNIVQPPIGLPEDLIRHFIRGFMDGNGSITRTSKQDYSISFTSTDSVLLWIMNHLKQHDIIKRDYPLSKRKPEHIVSGFEFGGNRQTKRFLDYIYQNATVWLDRKYQRYLDLTQLLNEQDNLFVPHNCAFCNLNKRDKHYYWTEEDEYKNTIVCKTHYKQLLKYGKIIPERKKFCEICGDTNGRMIQVINLNPEYFGATMCRKHFDQLNRLGCIKDNIPATHNIGE